jgi:membrane protease YdiL (CAAX protease family)
MLAVNVGLAALIPIAWALMAMVHQMRPRWLSSVQPRIRWRYLFGCLAIAAVALNGMMLLSTTIGRGLSFQPQEGLLGFLVVILLTSPIQAAAEEIFFRGYLLQALGSLVAKPWYSPCCMARRTCRCLWTVLFSACLPRSWSGAPAAWKPPLRRT